MAHIRLRFQHGVLILAVLTLTVGFLDEAAAEPTSDPNHPVYESIERWQARGIIDDMPVMQPYPRRVLLSALEGVRRVGNEAERSEAGRYLRALELSEGEDGRASSVSPFVEARNWFRDDEIQPKVEFGADMFLKIGSIMEVGANAGGTAIERGAEDLLPYGRRSTDDVLEDNAKVNVAGREIYTLLDINTQTTFQWDDLWMQAGILRRSYGPFHADSPVMSRQAPQSANFVLQWDVGPLRYTGSLSTHTATQVFREIRDPEDESSNIDVNRDGTDDFYDRHFEQPGKYLFIQSFGFQPRRWLEFSVFESIVFGPQLNPTYLVPVKFLWYAQGTSNFVDNSQIGISADIRPSRGWRIPLVVYVSDASFNDIVALNFDTKYKMATAAAVQWAPDHSWQPLIEASYETVFPYMYTHAALDPYTTEPNYHNYLHRRESIGNGLLPNSDRARLSAEASPASWVRLGINGAVLRHANASEGELDQLLNDGGYFDNGRDGEFKVDSGDLYWVRGDLTYNGPYRFLTQDTIETRYQTGVTADFQFPVAATQWALELGYTFEYVRNPIDYVWPEDSDEADVSAGDGGGGRTVSGSDESYHYGEIGIRVSY